MSRPRIFNRKVSALSALVLIGAAFGCTHATGAPSASQAPSQSFASSQTAAADRVAIDRPPPSAFGGGPFATDAHQGDPLKQVISARCEREQRCDNIGAQRPYASMADCVANVAVTHADDFAGLQCGEDGVRTEALSDCLTEIAHETCAPGARFASCRSIGLCNSI